MSSCSLNEESSSSGEIIKSEESSSSGEITENEESSSSGEIIKGTVSRKAWENQVNNLGCLDGNYEITTDFILGSWKYICVFQHAEDSYHYVEQASEYVGKYALPPGEENNYYDEEYLFNKDDKHLMFTRDDERYGFVKSYSDTEYDSLDKTYFCSIPAVFFRQLSYDDIKWQDDHYEASEMHERINYSSSSVYEYDSTEIKIYFDEYTRVSKYEYNTTINVYENDVLKETSNYIFSGSFTGHDNVVLTEPQDILLDRT